MLTRNLVSDKPPIISLLLIVGNVLLGSFLGMLLGQAIASSLYEYDLSSILKEDTLDPSILKPMMIIQGCGTLVGLILFPIIELKLIERKSISNFFPSQEKTGLMLLLIAFLGVTFILAMSPLTEWNMNWEFPDALKHLEAMARESEEAAAKLTRVMTNFGSVEELLMGLIVIAVLPAIGEELVFRGLIQNEFFRGTGRIHISIWASAFIFSAIHFQFFGFVPRLLLGALFGYLYFWSGNLLVPIFAHFFNNAFSVIMYYLYAEKITDLNPDDNTAIAPGFVLVHLVLTLGLLYYIRNHYQKARRNSTADFYE
jgi:membrane protease YdiL (CAAX protease family)